MSRQDVLVTADWAQKNLGSRTPPPTTVGTYPARSTSPGTRRPTRTAPSKSDDELAELYRDQGLGTGSPAITYCRIGEGSDHTWVVLHELLGNPDVKNYDSSWTEYGSLIGAPIALGDGR